MNAGIHPSRTVAELGLVDLVHAARPHLPGGTSVAAARAAGFNHFAMRGLPHSRVEAWKYTDLRRLMTAARPLAAAPDAAALQRAQAVSGPFDGLGLRRLVVVDGHFAADLSDLDALEPGLSIRSMASALALDEPLLSAECHAAAPEDDPAIALNTALAGDGLVVTVAPGAAIARPLHLVFINRAAVPAAMVTRSVLSVGAGARLTLVETHQAERAADYQVNAMLALAIGDGAAVDHIRLMDESRQALHLGTLSAQLGTDARFDLWSLAAGGAVARHQIFVQLAGRGAAAHLHGLNLLAGRQHGDMTLDLAHLAPNGASRALFKSVVDDEARAVFQGRISVAQAAQKTDAKMMARALLLSDAAEADSKPELEIFADDVQCGHGATTGHLDAELKFYLMARGIPDKQAEALLIEAFAAEVVEAIPHEAIRTALTDLVATRLGQRG